MESDGEETECQKTCTIKSLLKCNHSLHSDAECFSENQGKNWILLGQLVENREKSPRKRSVVSYLCLQDETGSIPCLISTAGPLVFGKKIMCLNWNLIKPCSDEPGYLEINNWNLLENDLHSCPTVNVLSSFNASWLLFNRNSVPQKVQKQVNVLGAVEFASEIFVVHGDPVFIINLDGKVDILLKGGNFLHWQQLIVPGRKYVFTNLRPTTLFKGKYNEHPVFVPWKGSSVQEVDYVPHKVLNLEEYCSSLGLDFCMEEEMEVECETSVDEEAELITYQGAVTDFLDSEIMLDNKAKFSVAFVNAFHKFSHIRPGCRVTFHNVHVIKMKQAGGVMFCCCLRSCLKIEKFPSHHRLGKTYESDKMPLWTTMNKFSLNCPELKQLSENYAALQEKLHPTFSRSVCEEVVKMLLDQSKIGDRKMRVFLDEVLQPGHKECAVAAERQSRTFKIPCLNEIEKSMSSKTEPKDKDWSFCVLDNQSLKQPQMLIGWLSGNIITGQLELRDQTGSIPCVISRHHSEAIHQCTLPDCCVPYRTLSLNPSIECACPYPQTWWMGVLLLIKDFHLVREIFRSASHTNDQSETKSRTYVLFSMTSVTVISTERANISKLMYPGSLEVHDSPSDDRHSEPLRSTSERPLITSQLMLVIHKDNLVVRSRMNDAAQLHFYVQACFIGEPIVYETGEGSLRPLEQAKNTEDKLNARYVALVFTGKNVRWYHLLHPECTYRLIYLNSNDVNAFKTKVKSKPLQRVIDKHAIEECLTVNDNAMLVRVGGGEAAGDEASVMKMCHTLSQLEKDSIHQARNDMWESDHIPEVNTVQEMLQKRQRSFFNELPLLSCEGVVKKRIYYGNNRVTKIARHEKQNEMLGVSMPGDPGLKLILADPDTGDTLEIIAQMTNMSYPLALIPGTRIRFTKLEQKPAAANFHCRVTVASNVSITALSNFSPSDETGRSLQDYNLSKLATVHLIDLIEHSSDSSLKHCDCTVSKVFQLQLQLVCLGCSMSANDWHLSQECTTCGTCQMPRIKAYAVVQVDDGTLSARVSCNADAVPQLLSLTDPQWRDLQLLVQTEGSVEYSLFSSVKGERPLDKFIETLCQSNHVCRPVSLVAHRRFFKDSQNGYNKKNVKVAGRPLETWCLPIIHLEAVAVLPQDFSKVANRLLSDLKV